MKFEIAEVEKIAEAAVIAREDVEKREVPDVVVVREDIAEIDAVNDEIGANTLEDGHIVEAWDPNEQSQPACTTWRR